MKTSSLPVALDLFRRGARLILSSISQEHCRVCERAIVSNFWLDLQAPPEQEALPALLDHVRADDLFSEVLCQQCFALINNSTPLLGFLALSESDPTALLPVASGVAYSGLIVNLIHRFKYKEDRLLTNDLTSLMLNGWSVLSNFVAGESPVLVPVPLHWHRHLKRGFNQSELLAKAAARHLELGVCARALKRTHATPPQHSLSKEARSTNLQTAFVGNKKLLQGRSIIVVDDICTSGATLSACAKAALEAGASHVTALTVARTPLYSRGNS